MQRRRQRPQPSIAGLRRSHEALPLPSLAAGRATTVASGPRSRALPPPGSTSSCRRPAGAPGRSDQRRVLRQLAAHFENVRPVVQPDTEHLLRAPDRGGVIEAGDPWRGPPSYRWRHGWSRASRAVLSCGASETECLEDGGRRRTGGVEPGLGVERESGPGRNAEQIALADLVALVADRYAARALNTCHTAERRPFGCRPGGDASRSAWSTGSPQLREGSLAPRPAVDIASRLASTAVRRVRYGADDLRDGRARRDPPVQWPRLRLSAS
jgi:hypothetical protein